MSLPTLNQSFIDSLVDISYHAGESIMRVYQDFRLPHYKLKENLSPLTEADLLSNELILEALKRLTPTIPIVSEEGVISQVDGETFWLIDPLDGTKEFLAKNAEFTVNIALISKAVPMLGIVYAPALQCLFYGGRELGTFKQMKKEAFKKIHLGNDLQKIQALTPLKVVTSRSHFDQDSESFICDIGYPYTISQVGSSIKFCMIAEGLFHLYPRFARTSEWDTAAGQAILEGAGGVVINRQGQRLHYGKRNFLNTGFVAATFNPGLFLKLSPIK